MRTTLLLSFLLVLVMGCKSNNKANKDVTVVAEKVKPDQTRILTDYEKAKRKAFIWTNNLNLDLDYVAKKNLGDKKHLAELLGMYWKIYQSSDAKTKTEVIQHIQPYYTYTKSPKYHNMLAVSDKLFKKNSMSYLRVMWLLKELDFDISDYQTEVKKVMNRMNTHLKSRGKWQLEVFKEYYHFFDFEMPDILKRTKFDNGLIDRKMSFDQYKKTDAYSFTHFVFAGFEYGNKTTQNRFDMGDLAYIKEMLPKFTKYYRDVKPNIDLLGEFFTCMVYFGFDKTDEFSTTYNYLLKHQNTNGSWGYYEKARKKIGDDIDFRAYLHTTLVVYEGLMAYNEGKFKGSKKE